MMLSTMTISNADKTNRATCHYCDIVIIESSILTFYSICGNNLNPHYCLVKISHEVKCLELTFGTMNSY